MAYESSIIVGSGQNPLKQSDGQLCPNPVSKERHLRGTQVVLINPEDASAGGSGLTTQVTVGTSAVKLPTTPLKYRRAIAIHNADSSATLYVGFSSDVATGTGFPIAAGACLPMDLNGAVEVYGISGGSIDVRILELS